MSEESLDDDIPLTIDESVGVDQNDDDDDDDADEDEEEETPIAAPSPLKQKYVDNFLLRFLIYVY